jgi:hypothetical protein
VRPRIFVPFKCIRNRGSYKLSREASVFPKMLQQPYCGKGVLSTASNFRVEGVGISGRISQEDS